MPEQFDVYRNLNRQCWSIRSTASRLVVAHARALILVDATWHVSPGGNARVRREGRKNVHAFARGVRSHLGEENLLQTQTYVGQWPFDQVTYNPYTDTQFQSEGETVRKSAVAFFHVDGTVTHLPE